MTYLWALVLLVVVGCGGGDDKVLLRDATVEHFRELCEYANDHIPEATDCGGGVVAGDYAPYDCSTVTEVTYRVPSTCEATIEDFKECIREGEDDPCYDDVHPTCDKIYDDRPCAGPPPDGRAGIPASR